MDTAVIEQIQQGFGYDHVELYTVEEDTEVLKLAARAGTFLPNGTIGYRQPLTQGLLGRALTIPAVPCAWTMCRPIGVSGAGKTETRSEVCVPIVASGRVLAVLNLVAPGRRVH